MDIDATLRASAIDIEPVFERLARHGIVPRVENALEFARQRQVVLAVHEATGINIDLSFAYLDFEEEAIRASEKVDYDSVRIPVTRAEDLAIYKMLAFRPRDIDDAEKLLTLHGASIRIRRVAVPYASFVAFSRTDHASTFWMTSCGDCISSMTPLLTRDRGSWPPTQAVWTRGRRLDRRVAPAILC